MDSNDTKWIIDPIDLFRNEKEDTFDKYGDLNLDELDIFLTDSRNNDKGNNNKNENYILPTNNQSNPTRLMTGSENNNTLYSSNEDKENQSNNILINKRGNSGQEVSDDSSEFMNPLVWDEFLSDCINSDLLSSNSVDNTVKDMNNFKQEVSMLDDLNKMDQQLLEQQEQLNIEIQNQKRMNKLLEEKLKQTQLQQQRLRKILKEQQSLNSMRFVLGDITRSSRLNNNTPKKRIKEFNVSKSTNNSPIKKSHNTKLSFVNPIYLTGINGSPKRRQYRFKNNISDNDSTKQKFQKIKEKKLEISLSTTLTPRDQDNFITESALSSPIRLSPNRSSTGSPAREHLDKGSPVLGVNLRSNVDIDRNAVSLQPLTNDSLSRSPINKTNNNNNNKECDLLDNLPTTFQDTPIRVKNYISPIDILMPPSEEDCETRSPSKVSFTQNTAADLYPSQEEMEDIPELLESNELQEKFVEVFKTSSPRLKLRECSEETQLHLNAKSEQSGSAIRPVSPSRGSRKKFTKLSRDELDRYVKELPDKLFECLYPNCGKFFKRRYNIRTHIQTHLEDRPYSCDFPGCNKAFVRNHDLIRHKKTHLKKKFVCPCGKVYYKEELLHSHQNKMICVGGKQYYNILTEQPSRGCNMPSRDVAKVANSLTSSNLTSSNESNVREGSNKENSYGTSLVFKMKRTPIDFSVKKQ